MDSTAAPSASSAPPALPDPPALTVLTQNIRCEVPGTRRGQADHWPERAPVLRRLLRAAEADVVGTQEVLPAQLPVLDEALGATHLRLGTGREEGGGEHNLLFLRRERFEVLAQQQFWLSERPERAGSLGWDAHCPRIAVLARVRDRASAQEMVLAVTHLDHAGEVARARGAALLAARLTDAAGEAPVVLMGDFNAAAGESAPWRTLREAGFEDAHDAAAVHLGEDIGTFPDYGPPQAGGTRIDWILTRGLAVEEYAATVPQHGGRAASDHATVTATVRTLAR